MSMTKASFDAASMMRSARDQISATIEDTTLDEELQWLALQKLHDPFLERLRDRAVQHSDAAGDANRRL